MNILFLTDNLSAHCGPNVNICLTLVKQMIKNNNVYLLSRYDDVNPVSKEFSDLFTEAFYVNASQTGKLISFTSGVWVNYSITKKIFKLAFNPSMLRLMVDAMFFEARITRKEYKKELERICREKEIDAVVGIVAPYYIAMTIAEARIDAKKAIIQLDPYTNIHSLSAKTKNIRLKSERKTLDRLDKVFATEFVIEDIIKNKIYDGDKFIEIGIPGIKTDILIKESQPIDKGRVNFLYAGQFFEDIRNPKYLLELFKKLPENYVLNLAGNGCEKIIDAYKPFLNDRLIIHGIVTKKAANDLIEKSDILINLGNSVSNQVPSKVYEYISTGKPILNIFDLENCKTIELINNYPKGLNVSDKEVINNILIKKIESFIKETPNIKIDLSIIMNKFEKYTDIYVSNKILSEIRKI